MEVAASWGTAALPPHRAVRLCLTVQVSRISGGSASDLARRSLKRIRRKDRKGIAFPHCAAAEPQGNCWFSQSAARLMRGAARFVRGSIRVVRGSARVTQGSVRLIQGSTRVVRGGIRVVMGSTRVVWGSTRVVRGSTRVTQGGVRLVQPNTRAAIS